MIKNVEVNVSNVEVNVSNVYIFKITLLEKHQVQINSFQTHKQGYLIHTFEGHLKLRLRSL